MDTPLIPDELSNEERVSGVWWKQIIAGGGAGAGERGRGGREGEDTCILYFQLINSFHFSSVSRTVTAPLDRLKVFFQTQSMRGKSYTIGSCLEDMLREGGVRSLWRGNGINVIKIAPESALRFFAFEKVREEELHVVCMYVYVY